MAVLKTYFSLQIGLVRKIDAFIKQSQDIMRLLIVIVRVWSMVLNKRRVSHGGLNP